MKVLHLFSGMGGGALGFKRAGFESVGNFDLDPAACRDLEYLTGEKATVADIGAMTPQDLADACTGRPDVVFTSPPCKGHSGCLPEAMAASDKYQALNSLSFHGVWLALEAWPTPPPLIIMENVPRIRSRGKKWLSQLVALLQAYGYAVSESTHDCGELGALAQRRRRYLMVARHMEQVPEVLYQAPKKTHQTVGDVFGGLPLPVPGSVEGGVMHSLPKLAALNWVRLALIPAGGDWRDLPERVKLRHRAGRMNGGFGVNDWTKPGHTVVGEGSVRNTWASIADPRSECDRREGALGVQAWDGAPSTAVIGHATIHNWPASVVDPRRVEFTHSVLGGRVFEDDRAELVDGPFVDLTNKRPIHMMIRAADGTWHRPMTTLELAALQGFPTQVDGKWLKLDGNSHKAWRQRIGNAVPPPAAEAIARQMALTLQASRDGSLHMSSCPIWVEPQRMGAML